MQKLTRVLQKENIFVFLQNKPSNAILSCMVQAAPEAAF